MASNPQHPSRRQLEAGHGEGAAPSQHWRLHLPSLKHHWHRAPRATLCVKAKPRRCGSEGPTPNKDHLLAWLPLKPPKPFPGCSRAAKGPCDFKSCCGFRNTQEAGVAKIRDLGRQPLAHTGPGLGISMSIPSIAGALLCQQQGGAWSPRAPTAKAHGRGSHPYKGHVHPLSPPTLGATLSTAPEEPHCPQHCSRDTSSPRPSPSAALSPCRQTLGWGTARAPPAPREQESWGAPRALLPVPTVTPWDAPQLTACPGQGCCILLP